MTLKEWALVYMYHDGIPLIMRHLDRVEFFFGPWVAIQVMSPKSNLTEKENMNLISKILLGNKDEMETLQKFLLENKNIETKVIHLPTEHALLFNECRTYEIANKTKY